MRKQTFFKIGQSVVLRQLSNGRIWIARPYIVVRDTRELLVLFSPLGSIWKDTSEKIKPAERPNKTWTWVNREWNFGGILRLTIPGSRYSVLLLTNEDGTPYKYYINLEEPIHRTKFGFDFEDNILDIWVEADLSSWSWQDEDELEEAVAAGQITREQAAALYSEGKAAVGLLQSGNSPFNGWEKWRPGPAWKMPVLPDDWDKL